MSFVIPEDWNCQRREWSEEPEDHTSSLLASLDDQGVHNLLRKRRWRWASSRWYQSPTLSHSYSIRSWTPDDVEFEAILRYVHDPSHSQERPFGRKSYLEWTDPFAWPPVESKHWGTVTSWFLWTMIPLALRETSGLDYWQYFSVLNRKPLAAREARPSAAQEPLQPRLPLD
jgi:hypothetical protein